MPISTSFKIKKANVDNFFFIFCRFYESGVSLDNFLGE